MKCPNCGAEAQGNFCDYCGTKLEVRPHCPRCSSENIKFTREKQGSVRSTSQSGRSSRTIRQEFYATTGFCQACGYTWTASADPSPVAQPKTHGVGWWILAILLWPFFLSVRFWKTDKVKLAKVWRVLILILFWLLLLSFSNQESKPVSDLPQALDTSSSAVISLVAGEMGEYGLSYTLNSGEDTEIVYEIPAGVYAITNTSDDLTQISLESKETRITEEGWKEPVDIKTVMLEPGQRKVFEMPEGYYFDLNGDAVELEPTSEMPNTEEELEDFIFQPR